MSQKVIVRQRESVDNQQVNSILDNRARVLNAAYASPLNKIISGDEK